MALPNLNIPSFYTNADELIQKLEALKKEKKEEDSDLEVAAKYKDVLTLFKVEVAWRRQTFQAFRTF